MYNSFIFVFCLALGIFLLSILVILLKLEYRQYRIDKNVKQLIDNCFDEKDNVLLYSKDGRAVHNTNQDTRLDT